MFNPAYFVFLKNRKNILYILSISLTLGIIISLIYNLYTFNLSYSNKIRNNIINRALAVSKNSSISQDEFDKIKSLDNVEFVYREMNSISMQFEKLFNMSLVYKSKNEIPDVILGSKFDDDRVEIILPSNFYSNKNECISLEEYVGKTVEISTSDIKINAYVCGVYDYNKTYSTYVYINSNFKEKLIEYNNEVESDKNLIVIANDYKDVDYIIKEIENEEYSARLVDGRGKSDIKIYNLASAIMIILIILTVIFSFILVTNIIDSIINDAKKDISILKAIGYKTNHLSKIILFDVLTITGISFVISILISLGINRLVIYLVNTKTNLILNYNSNKYGLVLLFSIVIICIISMISVKLNNRKIKNISSIELLKED